MMKNVPSILGFLLAGFCFVAWYGSRQGDHNQNISAITDKASIGESGSFGDIFKDRPLEHPNEVTRNKSSRVPIEDDSKMIAAAASTKISESSIQRGIKGLSDMAIQLAVNQNQQVPAGVSLALLIYSAERGKHMTTDNLRRVVDYLSGIKSAASEEDMQHYFKYASNSNKWFQGLGLAQNGSLPKAELMRIYDQYHLQQYDKDVYGFVTSPATSQLKFDKKVAPKLEAPAMNGDPSFEEVRRNQAYAKNRWVEKAGKDTEADVTFLPAKKQDESTINKARRLVESLTLGESVTFDNPNEYTAAVKEMIALENSYDSWSAYEAAVGKSKAEKVFRKRAEKGGVLATGTLKVTREQ